MKTKTPNNPITQKELKQAYSIVTNDLFQSLVKAKTNAPISVGTYGFIGALTKTEHKLKSALDNQTYVFYKLRFKMSSKLKRELNLILEKKYK